jgi:minor extracellular serine protease Vpr
MARRVTGSLVATGLVVALVGAGPPAPADDATDSELHLVTLDGPGTAGYGGSLPARDYRTALETAQDALLARVGAEPVYRWTTALNGFAAELTDEQASLLRSDPLVRLVEENAVRRLAGAPVSGSPAAPDSHGGAGVVVGMVDTGIWPESPLFASSGDLGASPRGFRGSCPAGEDWAEDSCDRKLVAARWFVHGFGEDGLRASSSLSPRDDHGHGTQLASIVAGNAGVSVQARGQRDATYSGLAPRARLAVYKACWTAPDPVDDGCATADLVTAIDRATRDRVDVLNLAVAGPPGFDTVERALLGAAEGDVVVVGAAGNRGRHAYAAHPSPWVLSVGGTTGPRRRGEVVLGRGVTATGAMASSRPVGPARLVLAEEVAVRGATRDEARLCTPGSLDASRTAGAVVLCRRGGIGRVAKSAAVRQADGIGMVLVNTRPGTVESDLHSVPTVHVRRSAAAEILAHHAERPRARVGLSPLPTEHTPARVARWSAPGDPTATLVKPDLVAPGAGVLGAVPPSVSRTRWDFASGTSAATAWTSGLAARLLARTHWGADRIRSALVTSAGAVAGSPSVLHSGAGRPRAERAERPGLAYLVRPGDYRAWLEGDLDRDLNTPSILLSEHGDVVRRTVTNVSRRAAYFSVRVSGFSAHDVTVAPLALRIAPGESASFRVEVTGPGHAHPLDDGWITWAGADGSRTRIPVVLTR